MVNAEFITLNVHINTSELTWLTDFGAALYVCTWLSKSQALKYKWSVNMNNTRTWQSTFNRSILYSVSQKSFKGVKMCVKDLLRLALVGKVVFKGN
jgi:hypothetical protein